MSQQITIWNGPEGAQEDTELSDADLDHVTGGVMPRVDVDPETGKVIIRTCTQPSSDK